MPQPIWESSQKPLHPKCVWIDSFGTSNYSGRRHFIFDYNISNVHLSFAKSVYCSCNNSNLSANGPLGSIAKINGTKLHDLSRDNSSKIDAKKQLARETARPLTKLIDVNSNAEIVETPQCLEVSEILANASTHINQHDFRKEQNFLANRVLQWLDLASGRDLPTLKRSEYIEKTLDKFKKRSLTAKETVRDSSPIREAKTKRQIHREPIHQLSMIFDDGDAMKSDGRDTIANLSGGSWNFGSIFPVTYRCSKKFLSLRRSATVPAKPSDLLDSMESMREMATTAKPEQRTKIKLLNKRHKIKRIDFVDEQYRAMIERQILEQSCNIQMAKRQLHIFMPFSDTEKVISNSVPSDLATMRLTSSAQSAKSNDGSISSERQSK